MEWDGTGSEIVEFSHESHVKNSVRVSHFPLGPPCHPLKHVYLAKPCLPGCTLCLWTIALNSCAVSYRVLHRKRTVLNVGRCGAPPGSYGRSPVGLQVSCLILELQIPTPLPKAHTSCSSFQVLILGNGLRSRSHLDLFFLHFQQPVSLQAYS